MEIRTALGPSTRPGPARSLRSNAVEEASGIENQIARRLLELGANRVARDLLLRDRFAPGMPIVGAHRGAMGLDGRITRYSGIYRDIPGYSGMGWKNNGISRDLMTPRRWLAWRWKADPRL